MAIDDWLRSQMAARKLSQRMLGARSGVEHSTISRLLRGERDPSYETLKALYGVFGGECPTCHRGPMMSAHPAAAVKQPLDLATKPGASVVRVAGVDHRQR